MTKWIALSLFLVCAAGFLFVTGRSSDLSALGNTLIAVNISVAIVATNFSFVAYQNSEYRQFQKGFSSILLFACVCMLFWGMTPLIAFVTIHREAAAYGVAALPLSALFSILLVGLAKHEGSPEAIVRRLRKREIKTAILRYSGLLLDSEKYWKKFELAEPHEMPMHEWDWYPAPTVAASNPFAKLSAIAGIAAKTGNVYVVVECLAALLHSLELCEKLRNQEKRKIPLKADQMIKENLDRLIVLAEQADPTGSIVSRILDLLASDLGSRTDVSWPPATYCFYLAGTMAEIGEQWMKKGHPQVARIPLIVIRLICQKGLVFLSKQSKADQDINSLFFSYNLRSLARMMQCLGSAAIQEKDSDFLYRVFDAFGWLGCSAVKCEDRQVALACVRALAQLGREARKNGLECHWDKCAVLPADHAKERIGWIMSWMVKMDPEIQEHWLPLISQGISRLSGRKTLAKIVVNGGQTFCTLDETSESHMESFSSEAGFRELDYSDFGMLKDFEFYGIMDLVVSIGPTVPLNASKSS